MPLTPCAWRLRRSPLDLASASGPFTFVLLGLADIHHILWTAQARGAEGSDAQKASHGKYLDAAGPNVPRCLVLDS